MRLSFLVLWCAAIIVLAACGQTTPDATATPPEPTSDATAQPIIAVAATATPAATPTPEPTATPTPEPTSTPTREPTTTPTHTASPPATPTPQPTETPTPTPTETPTPAPSTPGERLDSAVGERFLDLAWVKDGVSGPERAAVEFFSRIRSSDPTMAQTVLDFGWFADGMDLENNETNTLGSLAALAESQPTLVTRLLNFSWLSDGITEDETQAVRYIGNLAKESHSLAERLMSFPWIADGITEKEGAAIVHVKLIAGIDPEIADSVVNLPGEVGSLGEDALWSLYDILRSGRPTRLLGEQWFPILDEPWFQDGLTDEEAALIIVLRSAVNSEQLFQDLFRGAHLRSETVSLPLAGEVNLFAVSRSPFPRDSDILEGLGFGVEALEGFMGIPWPKTDVIVLQELESDFGQPNPSNGWNADTHIVVRDTSKALLYHELAHFLFGYNEVTRWLSEGAAEFLSYYTLQATGKRSIRSLSFNDQTHIAEKCAPVGAANVYEVLLATAKDSESPLRFCAYPIGAQFLAGLYRSLGHDVVSSSLIELYTTGQENRRATEDEIYQAFLSNTPPAKHDEFRELYACLHGRPVPGYTPAPATTPTRARDALAALYKATSGPGWNNNDNWLSEAPIDQWYGVITGCGGAVTGLVLNDNQLTGPIPPELGGLINLEQLRLDYNRLSGAIPQELANLPKLERLYIAGNQLTGCIPKDLQGIEDNDFSDTNLPFC